MVKLSLCKAYNILIIDFFIFSSCTTCAQVCLFLIDSYLYIFVMHFMELGPEFSKALLLKTEQYVIICIIFYIPSSDMKLYIAQLIGYCCCISG